MLPYIPYMDPMGKPCANFHENLRSDLRESARGASEDPEV